MVRDEYIKVPFLSRMELWKHKQRLRRLGLDTRCLREEYDITTGKLYLLIPKVFRRVAEEAMKEG